MMWSAEKEAQLQALENDPTINSKAPGSPSAGWTPDKEAQLASLESEVGHLAPAGPKHPVMDFIKDTPNRALKGALGAIPGAGMYQDARNPKSDAWSKSAAASGDAGGGLMAVATGGLSVPVGMAANAVLEGSGLNPLARAGEAAIENDPKAYIQSEGPGRPKLGPIPTSTSVPWNFAQMIPQYAAGGIVGLLPSIVSAFGAAKGVAKLPQTKPGQVAPGQEFPALSDVIRKGIGPETEFTKGGQQIPKSQGSDLLSVLDNVKKTRSQLGNNMGQMTALADAKLGPLNPKSFQPQIGNAVSNALQESGVSTPQAKAAVQKWFDTELPEINTLSDLHGAIKNFNNSIKGHLGVEGSLSSVPLGAMKEALGNVLESHIPEELQSSFGQAKNAFSQYATLEDGLKASTPGLQAKLKNKTPTVGLSTELKLDPGKFSKWWNETLSASEKARFDPEFRQAIDNLTKQPGKGALGKLSELTNELIKNGSLGVSKGIPVLDRLSQPPKPSFSAPRPSYFGKVNSRVSGLMESMALRQKQAAGR